MFNERSMPVWSTTQNKKRYRQKINPQALQYRNTLSGIHLSMGERSLLFEPIKSPSSSVVSRVKKGASEPALTTREVNPVMLLPPSFSESEFKHVVADRVRDSDYVVLPLSGLGGTKDEPHPTSYGGINYPGHLRHQALWFPAAVKIPQLEAPVPKHKSPLTFNIIGSS
ncbi:hypothetical protein BDZ45DRAFT_738517 [Acephala macrosclerotiorum]|nr:hypothetical protein BDZ45DRAFT_738517 [Acephala macrosclerotiorum]